jgi:5'-nucleotidase
MIQKKILISNDDGVNSRGLAALVQVAKEFGNVLVVAPNAPRSGMSNAITVELPVRLKKIEENEQITRYSCTGTPVDCIKLAFDKLLDRKPDLILSGINHGTNSSVSVHYSGTMGAAIEGCIHDVPSIGFSLCDHSPNADFDLMLPFVRNIIIKVLENGLPKGTCLNVNAPKGKPTGIEICRQGKGRWVEEFDKRTDPQKRDYYWITGFYKNLDNGSIDTDNHFLETNKVSIVPVKIDMTDYKALEELKKWML